MGNSPLLGVPELVEVVDMPVEGTVEILYLQTELLYLYVLDVAYFCFLSQLLPEGGELIAEQDLLSSQVGVLLLQLPPLLLLLLPSHPLFQTAHFHPESTYLLFLLLQEGVLVLELQFETAVLTLEFLYFEGESLPLVLVLVRLAAVRALVGLEGLWRLSYLEVFLFGLVLAGELERLLLLEGELFLQVNDGSCHALDLHLIDIEHFLYATPYPYDLSDLCIEILLEPCRGRVFLFALPIGLLLVDHLHGVVGVVEGLLEGLQLLPQQGDQTADGGSHCVEVVLQDHLLLSCLHNDLNYLLL